MLFTFLAQSCSDDLEDPTTDEFTAEARRGGGGDGRGGDGRGGDGNNGPNGEAVSSLSADVLTEWTDLFLELDRYATGMRPNATARAIGYINLAAYEVAVPGMRDYLSNEGRLPGLRIGNNSQNVNWNIALNTAYADVIDHFLISVIDHFFCNFSLMFV